MPFVNDLFMSSRPRAYLECLQISRSRGGPAKTLPKEEIENRLEQLCRIQGEDALNQLRDQARRVASSLDMKREFEKLSGDDQRYSSHASCG